MNSNENALVNTAQELDAYLESGSNESYLADALSAWDEEECRWVDGAPLVLRTEGRDITIWWPNGKNMEICLESIDDYGGFTARAFLPDTALWSTLSHRISWRQRTALSDLIGCKVESAFLARDHHGDALWVAFDDGSNLALSANGIMLAMRTPALKTA